MAITQGYGYQKKRLSTEFSTATSSQKRLPRIGLLLTTATYFKAFNRMLFVTMPERHYEVICYSGADARIAA